MLYQEKYNKKINVVFYIQILIVIIIFSIFYLKLKIDCVNLYELNDTLQKRIFFSNIELQDLTSKITSLRRSDIIRQVAEQKLNMYYPEPESLYIQISNE